MSVGGSESGDDAPLTIATGRDKGETITRERRHAWRLVFRLERVDGTGCRHMRYPHWASRPDADPLIFYQQVWFPQMGTPGAGHR